MKKTIVVLVALLFLLPLGACGEKLSSKSGVLTHLAPYSISITASDGTVYKYSIDGETALDYEKEALGDTLEVVSRGQYKDGIHAEEVKFIKAAQVPPVAVQAVYGKIVDATNSSVMVEANDGNAYMFTKNEETVVHSGNGILVGDFVEVVYTGSLSENNAVAQSIIITSEVENKAAPTPKPKATPAPKSEATPAPKPESTPVPTPEAVPTTPPEQPINAGTEDIIWYVDGECVDDTMNSILLMYEGVTYTVLKNDSTVVVGDIAVGDTIRVFHTGSLSDGMNATKIALVSKAEGAQADFDLRKIYGTILDETKSSLTISTDDGTEANIIKTDDTQVKVESLVGSYVEVLYRDVTEDGYLIAVSIE